jgi:signal peptide peptidase SppA
MKKPDLAALITLLNTSAWALHPAWLARLTTALTRCAESGEWRFDEVMAQRFSAARAKEAGGGMVAVVPIIGIITQRGDAMDEIFGRGSVPAEILAALMGQLGADEAVGAVVLDVDSPGGRTGALELAADAVHALREKKPVVAVANPLMASAAYWIASAASEIVATPESEVGSIGVWTAHIDASKFYEDWGFKITLLSAGKYKTEGHPFGPLTDEAKAHIQSQVDEAYAMFLKTVARNRGSTPAKVRDEYGEGRVLTAKEALKAGLIDRVGMLGDVIGGLQAKLAKRGASARAAAERSARIAQAGRDARIAQAG